MPHWERNKVGEIHRYRKVKTFWDQVKEFLEGMFVLAVLIGVLVAIFG